VVQSSHGAPSTLLREKYPFIALKFCLAQALRQTKFNQVLCCFIARMAFLPVPSEMVLVSIKDLIRMASTVCISTNILVLTLVLGA
jgi:spore maturation protein SpmB